MVSTYTDTFLPRHLIVAVEVRIHNRTALRRLDITERNRVIDLTAHLLLRLASQVGDAQVAPVNNIFLAVLLMLMP